MYNIVWIQTQLSLWIRTIWIDCLDGIETSRSRIMLSDWSVVGRRIIEYWWIVDDEIDNVDQ